MHQLVHQNMVGANRRRRKGRISAPYFPSTYEKSLIFQAFFALSGLYQARRTNMVEHRRFELLTFALRTRRATNCANAPCSVYSTDGTLSFCQLCYSPDSSCRWKRQTQFPISIKQERHLFYHEEDFLSIGFFKRLFLVCKISFVFGYLL